MPAHSPTVTAQVVSITRILQARRKRLKKNRMLSLEPWMGVCRLAGKRSSTRYGNRLLWLRRKSKLRWVSLRRAHSALRTRFSSPCPGTTPIKRSSCFRVSANFLATKSQRCQPSSCPLCSHKFSNLRNSSRRLTQTAMTSQTLWTNRLTRRLHNNRPSRRINSLTCCQLNKEVKGSRTWSTSTPSSSHWTLMRWIERPSHRSTVVHSLLQGITAQPFTKKPVPVS